MSIKIPTEIYDRVVGYYRPRNQANLGKQAELCDRKKFDVNNKKKNYPEWKNNLTLLEV